MIDPPNVRSPGIRLEEMIASTGSILGDCQRHLEGTWTQRVRPREGQLSSEPLLVWTHCIGCTKVQVCPGEFAHIRAVESDRKRDCVARMVRCGSLSKRGGKGENCAGAHGAQRADSCLGSLFECHKIAPWVRRPRCTTLGKAERRGIGPAVLSHCPSELIRPLPDQPAASLHRTLRVHHGSSRSSRPRGQRLEPSCFGSRLR